MFHPNLPGKCYFISVFNVALSFFSIVAAVVCWVVGCAVGFQWSAGYSSDRNVDPGHVLLYLDLNLVAVANLLQTLWVTLNSKSQLFFFLKPPIAHGSRWSVWAVQSLILSDEEQFGSFYTSDVHTHQSVCFHAQFKQAGHENLTLTSCRSLVLVPVYLEKKKSNNWWNMPSSALGGDMHLFNGMLCPLSNWPVLSHNNQLK